MTGLNANTVFERRRVWLLVFACCLVLVLLVPLASSAREAGASPISVPNPGADLWRDVRHGNVGTSQVKGVDAGVLVESRGEDWRLYRMELLAPWGGLILGGMVGVFLLYYLIRGPIPIEEGRSGVLVERYTRAERWVHWLVAVPFVLLALSGLVLLFGRFVMLPLFGPGAFSVIASASKFVHNWVGPFFVVMVPIMIFMYLRDSLFNLKVDSKWFLQAGGYLGGPHPSSEKVNAGQKVWYWTAALTGLALSVSGLILQWPELGQGRVFMQGAHVVHTLAAVAVTAFFVVHVYLATIGVKGALETMRTGYADANWVRQHHDLWYRELQAKGRVPADLPESRHVHS